MPDAQPTYLTTNPDGTVGANFSGRVQADGMTITPGGSDNTLGPDNVITWVTVGGAQVAQIGGAGLDSGGRRSVLIEANGVANSQSGLGSAGVTLEAEHFYDTGLNNHRSALLGVESSVEGATTPTPRIFYAFRKSGNVISLQTLLDSNGNSAFVQMASPGLSRLMWGQVSSTGTITRGGSNDWTVARSAVGTYVITANSPVTTQGWIPVCTLTNAFGFASPTTQSLAAFTVQTTNTSGVNTDAAFSFIAMAIP